MKVVHELCCGTMDEVEVAAELGVDRIELCCALACGGLTPTLGMVERAKRLGLETMAMVRSREGGFVYSDHEFHTMVHDAKAMVEAGVDGLVFGFLTEGGTLDHRRMERMVEFAQGRVTMVHRACDQPSDLMETARQLVDLGVDRMLTSGKGGQALDGAGKLAELQQRFGDRIQVVAGGGIRPENVAELVRASGVRAVHYAARADVDKPGYGGIPDPTCDPGMVREMKLVLAGLASSG